MRSGGYDGGASKAADPAPEVLALLLHEANFAPDHSVQRALDEVEGASHPRLALLIGHLTQTKRACWTCVAEATGTTLPPDAAGLRRLMVWEVERVRTLTPEHLAAELTCGAQVMTVAERLRLNARHSVWSAGQLAALAGPGRSA